jgi:signal transduction histidine kinase
MLADFRVRQRDYLLEISRAITAQLDLAAVLRFALEAAVEMLAGQAGLIALRQEEGGFAVRASFGLPESSLELLNPLWADLPEAEEQVWRGVDLERRLALASATAGIALRQVVALPMSVAGVTVGAIYVFRRWGGRFSANDRQVLASFADQAAVAVHNAQLYEQVAARNALCCDNQYSADGVMIWTLLTHSGVQSYFDRTPGWTAVDALGREHDEVIRGPRLIPVSVVAARAGWPLTRRPAGLRPETAGRRRSTLYVEGDLRRRDGSTISVGITYAPLLARDGRLVNTIVDVHDITRFREAEELKSTFVSVISHELKTPVSLIKGYAGTLRREDARWDEKTLRESLAVIEERRPSMGDRQPAGCPRCRRCATVEYERGGLDDLARRVVSIPRPSASKARRWLSGRLSCGKRRRARLEQVLKAPLTNAIKYSQMAAPSGSAGTCSE